MLQRSQGLAVLMMVLLVLQVSNPVAFGQSAAPPVAYTYSTYVQNQVTVNNCSAGEPVALSGTVTVQYSVGADSNGNNLFYVTGANDLTGVGQSTGTQYAAADSEDYILSSSQSSTVGTVQLKAELAPQGGGGINMTVIQQLQISVDTVGDLSVQVVGNTTSCGS